MRERRMQRKRAKEPAPPALGTKHAIHAVIRLCTRPFTIAPLSPSSPSPSSAASSPACPPSAATTTSRNPYHRRQFEGMA